MLANAMFAEVLDALRAGLFLVTAHGTIRHANVSGLAMLRNGAVLGAASGRLVANDAGAGARLNEAFAAAGLVDADESCRGAVFPVIGRDGARYVMHVMPLSSAQSAEGLSDAVAALFVYRVEMPAESPTEALANAYGLTVSELKVMMTIVQVGSVGKTVKKLGIAESTVRTHLHRLFAKTGGERQADLVRIVAGFTSPLI